MTVESSFHPPDTVEERAIRFIAKKLGQVNSAVAKAISNLGASLDPSVQHGVWPDEKPAEPVKK